MWLRSDSLFGNFSEQTPHQFSCGSYGFSVLSTVEPDTARLRCWFAGGWFGAALFRSRVTSRAARPARGVGCGAGAPRFFTSCHGIESSATWLRKGLAVGSTGVGAGRVFSSEEAKSAYRLLPGGAILAVAAFRLTMQR
jgi:hypothetical protein